MQLLLNPAKIPARKKDLVSFGLIVGAVLLLFGAWPLLHGADPRGVPSGLGIALAACAAVIPSALLWPYRAWMVLGSILGFVNTRILLTIIFYGSCSRRECYAGFSERIRSRSVLARKPGRIRCPSMNGGRIISNISSDQENPMLSFFQELWMFAREHKKLWLLPIIFVFLLLGVLLVFTQGSVVAPFIYTLF